MAILLEFPENPKASMLLSNLDQVRQQLQQKVDAKQAVVPTPAAKPLNLEYPVGRLLTLNPDKVAKFQCRGYVLGPRCPQGIVPEEANLAYLRQAIEDGVLIDITDTGIKTDTGTLGAVESQEAFTLYIQTRQFFDDAGITLPETDTNEGPAEVILYPCSDPEERQRIEAQLRVVRLAKFPGCEDPDKYLLRINP